MKTLKAFLCTLLLALCIPTQSYAIDTNLLWDMRDGILTISGSGEMPIFESPEEQPWASVRDQITEIRFSDPGSACIDNMQYWFTNCVNLRRVEIPYTAHTIGEKAFANCSQLTEIMFYYYDEDDFEIVPSAFHSDTHVDTKVYLISDQAVSRSVIQGYDWDGNNRHVEFYDVYSQESLTVITNWCSCLAYQREVYIDYWPNDSTTHSWQAYCYTCGGEGPVSTENHSFSGDRCTLCNYYNHACSWVTTSTSGCQSSQRCSSCGATRTVYSHTYIATGEIQQANASYHYVKQKCSKCGTLSNTTATCTKVTSYTVTDTTHTAASVCTVCQYASTSAAASHSYYNNICRTCGYTTVAKSGTLSEIPEGSVIYINENGQPQAFYVAKHDYESGLNGEGRTLLLRANMHSKRAWNSTTANTYTSSTLLSWLNSEYKDLLDDNVQVLLGSTAYYGTAQGGSTVVEVLSSGVFMPSPTEMGLPATYSNVEGTIFPSVSSYVQSYFENSTTYYWTRSPYKSSTANAVLVYTASAQTVTATTNTSYGVRPCFTLPDTAYVVGDGTISTDVTVTWNCDGNVSTETYTPGTVLVPPTAPAKSNYKFSGWYTAEVAGTKLEENAVAPNTDTTYYAQYVQVFSVTVPAILPIAVASDGGVHAAQLSITNNSTGDVKLSTITINALNGWTLVPYISEMATVKVDAKQIGFKIQDMQTTLTGTSETLTPSSLVIPEGTAANLDYLAVISASSTHRAAEEVLQVVFVLQWAST